MKRRYPLEAARTLRRQVVDERTVAMAEQRRRAEQAEAEAKAREAQRHQAEAKLESSVDEERKRVESGAARAADLAWAASFHSAEQARIAELEAAEHSAKQLHQEERRAEGAAQRALAEAEAEAKALDKHRSRWQAERERRAELAEEEEVQDAWLGRAQRRGGEP